MNKPASPTLPDARFHPPERRDSLPTRRQALLFFLKTSVLRRVRSLREVGKAPAPLKKSPIPTEARVIAESRTPLYTTTSPEEWALQAGKVQNLRLAARALDGSFAPANQTVSFWANVGRATARRGFVRGRELREGCVIPNLGGGLCQISNALYDVALQAGAEIVERHAHTRKIPGSTAAAGRDATVFWNYVDLRFRSSVDTWLTAQLTREELIVRLLATEDLQPVARTVDESTDEAAPVETCETCGIGDCFRHASAAALPRSGGAAFLLDAYQPEFDTWLREQRQPGDHLLVPLDSRRYRLGPYRWSTSGFATIHQAPLAVVHRSLVSRKLASQGAPRQRALLAMDHAMATALARRLPPLANHLTVSQNLLPFLWHDGWLGGRTFDVLMTRAPLRELEQQLDRAAQAHPESPTLADFRAPTEIVQWEAEALAAASRWITPHSAIAPGRTHLLDWQLPKQAPIPRGTDVIFPASTLGRKGAYELREAARQLGNITIRLGGPILESPNFWSGLNVQPAGENWLQNAAVVVLPAWVEHQPRRLLRAVAAGIPVIASEACGLKNVPGVTTIPCGDAEALKSAITSTLANKSA
ncbi:hypothetical protein BH09VER1_BH09VER1_01040 [soil metagenome]